MRKASNKIGKERELSLDEIAVIVTVTGGGFTKMHKLYAVTHEKEVYTTKIFNEKEKIKSIQGEYIGKVKSLELGDCKSAKRIILDAPEVKVYKVENQRIIKVYKGYLCDGSSPDIARNVQSLEF